MRSAPVRIACACALLAIADVHAADGSLEVMVEHAHAADPDRVTIAIRNGSAGNVAILGRGLPASALTNALLDVRRDGQPVRYIGLRASRPPPSDADYLTLAPGGRLTYSVDLSRHYDLSLPGTYYVRYDADLLANALQPPAPDKRVPAIASAGTTVRLDADDVSAPIVRAAPAKGTGLLSFDPSCTSTERSALTAATIQARRHAALGIEYFDNRLRGARYAQWFGAYDPIRYGAATSRMAAIEAATRQANLEFECIAAQSQCPDRNVVAYVSPASAYRIYVCPHLYDYPTAPAHGSGYAQSGVIIHEVSHFFAVDGGTEDFTYGYAQSASLAATHPANALRNADNWMYHAMNQPELEPDWRSVFRSGFE